MSRLDEIRQRAHNRLEEWEHALESLETLLEDAGEQAIHRLRDTGSSLAESAGTLQKKLEPAAQGLRQSLDELRVQAALGKAETRDALLAKRHDLRARLDAVESSLETHAQELDERAHAEVERVVRGMDRLRTELEVLEVQAALGKAEAKQALGQAQGEVRQRITAARAELGEASQHAGERWQAFESRMGNAIHEIRVAFKALGGD